MAKYDTRHIDLKHLGWFVLGAVHSYCDHTKALGSHEMGKRMALYGETLELVWSHLCGEQPLNSRLSDMQVSIAEEAVKVFKPRLAWEAEARQILDGTNEEDWRKRASAVKRVRELTGWDLKRSAFAVDSIIRGDDPTRAVVEGGICDHCGEPNMAHMGSNCRGGR